MQARDERLFLRFSTPVSWVARNPLVEPTIQYPKVGNLKNKDGIKQIDKAVKIPAAAAKERCCHAVIIEHSLDIFHVPNLMLLLPHSLVQFVQMGWLVHRLPGFWIAPIHQLPVSVQDVKAAPLQLFGNGVLPAPETPSIK